MDGLPPVPEYAVQQMLWKFALRSTEHAVLLLDARGFVTWANPGAAVILGATPGSLVGTDVARFFTRRDIARGIPEHEREEALQRGTASDDRWMVRADRSRFWASGVTVYLDAESRDGAYLKLFRDLTDVKMQLESSRARNRAAEQTSETLTAAIGLLAHELRNPLSAIGLAANVLQKRFAGDPQAATPLEAIGSNVALGARLIEDLMQHSKVTSEGFSLDRTRCNVRELLESSASIARRQLQQDDRPISVLVPSSDIDMEVDRMRMQQVFVNLIANALRYTPAPGRIWVVATFEGAEVIVRVADEGVGIEPERLERLFELFTLPKMKGSKLGLGLGLALVKKIVELHGGSVQARSEGLNKGSQFIVRFPALEQG